MTRKLPFLFVVVAAISAVTLLQAQDGQYPHSHSDAKTCAFCNSANANKAAGQTKATQEGTAFSNCASCGKSTCQSCPACTVQSLGLDTHVQAAWATVAGAPPTVIDGSLVGQDSVRPLPGSTSFMKEQSLQTTNQREQLALQLTQYLAASHHDPVHIRQVLQMALDSAADTARRQAMMNHNQPLASAPSQTYNVDDDIQYFEKGPEYILVREQGVAAVTSCDSRLGDSLQPPPPVLDETKQGEMDLQRLQREQESMQDVISLIQQDLQKIAEDLSQLHVESRMHSTPTTTPATQSAPQRFTQAPNRRMQWQSVPDTSYQSGQPATAMQSSRESEYVELLKREIDFLHQQLKQMQNQGNSQTRSQRVQQADFEQSLRLEPRASSSMRLTPPPASKRPITISYYVGDLMEPPFAGATLKLMKFIKASVAPGTWVDSRMMQISDPSISLVITQTRENHDQIAELLRQIRIGSESYLMNVTAQRR